MDAIIRQSLVNVCNSLPTNYLYSSYFTNKNKFNMSGKRMPRVYLGDVPQTITLKSLVIGNNFLVCITFTH